MESLKTMISKISGEIIEMKAHIKEMDRCINTETTITATAKAKRERNEGIHKQTTTMCKLFKDEYDAAEEARV